MKNMSTLEKAVFEFVNIASDVSVVTGLSLLITGNKSGAFYLIAGACGEIMSIAHESAMKYRRSDMFAWSKIKYSAIPPFAYVGKDNSN